MKEEKKNLIKTRVFAFLRMFYRFGGAGFGCAKQISATLFFLFKKKNLETDYPRDRAPPEAGRHRGILLD